MGLITIRRYRDLSEAIVARSFLEASGFAVQLCDENLVRLDWQISNFIGGIRLQVDLADEAEAAVLLDAPVPAAINYGAGTEQSFLQPQCPRCDSINISFEGSSRRAALTSLYLFSLPLPLGRATWRCGDCGCQWTGDEKEET